MSTDLATKVQELLDSTINPAVAGHGGFVQLIDVKDNKVYLQMGGGCQGCGAADITLKSGIELRPTWVAFTPWTALSDYRDLLDFIEARRLIDHVDPVQYSLRLLVPPGSLLLRSSAMAPYLGALEEETLSHRWTHPDPRMDRLQEEVAAVVSQAASRGEDTMVTFDRVRALADMAAGEPARMGGAARSAPDRPRPPRLTEPWFC